jgi:ABC-type phosphate/phosphonate transport system permease subunit
MRFQTTCLRPGCPAFGKARKGYQRTCTEPGCTSNSLRHTLRIQWRVLVFMALIVVAVLTFDQLRQRDHLLEQVNQFFQTLRDTLRMRANI